MFGIPFSAEQWLCVTGADTGCDAFLIVPANHQSAGAGSSECTRIYIHVAAARYEIEMGEGGVYYALRILNLSNGAITRPENFQQLESFLYTQCPAGDS